MDLGHGAVDTPLTTQRTPLRDELGARLIEALLIGQMLTFQHFQKLLKIQNLARIIGEIIGFLDQSLPRGSEMLCRDARGE